jgi:hypothetical protein
MTPSTTQTWAGHWHGYGPWIGSPAVYAREGGRRPPHPQGAPSVSDPKDKKQVEALDRYREAAAEFDSGSVPPTMTGYWLLKRNQTSLDRTWTTPEAVMAWLTKQYEANPPLTRTDGGTAYGSLDDKLAYAAEALPRGVDVTWAYYTPAQAIASYSVVCCPNRFHPQTPCPLPPT